VGKGYCFFSGVAGVAGCEPPVDLGPGVTPALFSVEPLESLAAVGSELGFAPFVGPLPASSVDTAPFVGPASAFDWANAGADKPTAIIKMIKLPRNEDMPASLDRLDHRTSNSIDHGEFRLITASSGSHTQPLYSEIYYIPLVEILFCSAYHSLAPVRWFILTQADINPVVATSCRPLK
jgi:hypothetical protein